MKVRLEVASGELVAEDWLLPFPNELPRVIIWGERIFVWHGDGEIVGGTPMHNFRTIPVYREAFFFAIPQPKMFRPQAMGMLAAGKLDPSLYT